MIAADILGPWAESRQPQFIADVSDALPWRDVTAQAAERIPPTPGLCVWRVWCSGEQLAQFEALPAYAVLRSAEVARAHRDPADWPIVACDPGQGSAAFAALPDSGWLEEGAIYLYGETTYIVRQAHTRTEFAPADVPALFMVHRENVTDALAWVAGEQVVVGTQRTYDGTTYTCLQAHVTQQDWTPPAVLALWQAVVVVPATGAWAVGVAYKVGDAVTYNGKTYACRQAHTSISTWTPTAAASLWLEVTP